MKRSYALSLLLALIIVSSATSYIWAQEPVSTPSDNGTPTSTPPPQATEGAVIPLIVGGRPADPGEYPWMVALVNASSANPYFSQFCGGALIDPEWVLTAAHCVVFNGFVTHPDDIDVVLGVNNLDEGPTSGSSGQRIGVAHVVPYPAYREATSDSDVALLHLAAPASLAPATVDTIDLASLDDGALVAPGTIATVTGWGVTSEGSPFRSNALLEVDVPIVSNATCNAPASYDGAVTDNMLCAGFADGGKDSCQGDSGGPLIVPDGSGGWLVAGVVSWGDGCARPDLYGVYARVSPFKSWIDLRVSGSGLAVYLPIVFNTLGGSVPTVCTPDPPGESDNIADALKVCSGQTVAGQVDGSDLDDVYQLFVSSGGHLTVSMNGSGGDADLYLYPPGTTDVNTDPAYAVSADSSNTEFIQLTVPSGGFWYVDVFSYAGATDYSLTLSVASP